MAGWYLLTYSAAHAVISSTWKVGTRNRHCLLSRITSISTSHHHTPHVPCPQNKRNTTLSPSPTSPPIFMAFTNPALTYSINTANTSCACPQDTLPHQVNTSCACPQDTLPHQVNYVLARKIHCPTKSPILLQHSKHTPSTPAKRALNVHHLRSRFFVHAGRAGLHACQRQRTFHRPGECVQVRV